MSGRSSDDLANHFCSIISDLKGKDEKDFCLYGFSELKKGKVDTNTMLKIFEDEFGRKTVNEAKKRLK
jgi:hypothetical protein